MIGGDATNVHGYQRYTGDIHLCTGDTIENRADVRRAFRECEMGDYYMLATM
ncbi:MAG: hypothetical protein JWQ40_182 [Segetibacter sp.]|nr:hypothetical protein [Segetibacter sp.]